MVNTCGRRLAWLVTFLYLLTSPVDRAWAQTPAWQWATSIKNGQRDAKTAVDAAGNVLIAGTFSGKVTFGATTLTSAGGEYEFGADVFVAKLNRQGAYVWAVRAGGSDYEKLEDLTVAKDGTVYVVGKSSSLTATFGNTKLLNTGTGDVFVAKLDSAGVWQWAARAGSNTIAGSNPTISGQGIAVDSKGNTYVTGWYKGQHAFGDTAVTGGAKATLFVAKLNPAGSWLWATCSSSCSSSGSRLATDENDDVYVAGSFKGPMTLGAITLANSSENNRLDLFVAKLNPAGNWQWGVSAGGSKGPYGSLCEALAVDHSGGIVTTGRFVGPTATFGSTTLLNRGGADAFVAKLTPAGTWQWAVSVGGPNLETGNALAIDANDEIYLAANFVSDTVRVGATTLVNKGKQLTLTAASPFVRQEAAWNNDILIAKLSPAGEWQWAIGAGSLAYTTVSSLSLAGNGSLYVAGEFSGNTPNLGRIALKGRQGTFLARLSPDLLSDPTANPVAKLALRATANQGTVQVSIPAGTTRLDLVDAAGRIVRTLPLHAQPETSNEQLDLTGLSPGLYTVRVGAQTQRLVVE